METTTVPPDHEISPQEAAERKRVHENAFPNGTSDERLESLPSTPRKRARQDINLKSPNATGPDTAIGNHHSRQASYEPPETTDSIASPVDISTTTHIKSPATERPRRFSGAAPSMSWNTAKVVKIRTSLGGSRTKMQNETPIVKTSHSLAYQAAMQDAPPTGENLVTSHVGEKTFEPVDQPTTQDASVISDGPIFPTYWATQNAQAFNKNQAPGAQLLNRDTESVAEATNEQSMKAEPLMINTSQAKTGDHGVENGEKSPQANWKKQPAPSTPRLFVNKLDFTATEEDIRSFFGSFQMYAMLPFPNIC